MGGSIMTNTQGLGPDRSGLASTLQTGIMGGVLGGMVIWLYEAIVWVGVQHMMPLAGLPSNATGLVFGKAVQAELGLAAAFLGTAIHFSFAAGWGAGFALIWPYLRRRGIEATLAALFYAVIAWGVMHIAIALASSSHPNYLDPTVVIGGLMSHIFFTVPMALVVRNRLR